VAIKSKLAVSLVFVLLAAAGCQTGTQLAQHSAVQRVVVFGDSNVDTGNLQKLSDSDQPMENSWRGRNSNGPVVTEYLAEKLGAELITYAVGGATTGEHNVVSDFFPDFVAAKSTGVSRQIEDFQAIEKRFNETDLVVIWAGSNDILQVERSNARELKQKINQAAANIGKSIDRAHQMGARRLVVATRTVRAVHGSDDDLNGRDLNQLIKLAVANRAASLDLSISLFDAYAEIQKMVLNPSAYGFREKVDALCVEVSDCAKEDYDNGLKVAQTFINWDYPHKTTRVHELMADTLFESVQSMKNKSSGVSK